VLDQCRELEEAQFKQGQKQTAADLVLEAATPTAWSCCAAGDTGHGDAHSPGLILGAALQPAPSAP